MTDDHILLRAMLRTSEDLRSLVADLQRLPLPIQDGQMPLSLVVERIESRRSLAQNSLYWWYLGIIAEHHEATAGKKYSDEDWHEYLKRKFLRTKVIKVRRSKIVLQKSTAKLTVKQFSAYLLRIEHWANEELDLVLPRPADLYWAAVLGPGAKQKPSRAMAA